MSNRASGLDRRLLSRRRFLRAAVAALPATAAAGGGLHLLACGDPSSGGVAPAPVAGARWPDSLTDAGHVENDLVLEVLAGRLPSDLQGHSFVVCSLPFPEDVSSPFNGLGMLYRFDLDPAGVAMKNRILRTDDYYVDEASAGTPWAFDNAGIARFGRFGVRNFVNTALLPMEERLLATFDAGRPHLVDPMSLEIVTPIGFNREWPIGLDVFGDAPLFPVHFTSAHPQFDPNERRYYGVAYGGTAFGGKPFASIMTWENDGAVVTNPVVLPDGSPVAIRQSMHQMAITREHIVLCDASFVNSIDPYSPGRARSDVDYYIVPKGELGRVGGARAVHVVIPREAAHFQVDYDDVGGRIVLHAAHGCGASSGWMTNADTLSRTQERIDPRDSQKPLSSTDVGRMGRYEIDATTGVLRDAVAIADEAYTWGPALYSTTTGEVTRDRHESLYWVSMGFSPANLVSRVVNAFLDYPHRTVAIADLPQEIVPGALFRFDADRGAIADAYAFPTGYFGLSPQFVPGRGRSGPREGYVITTVVSDQPDGSSSGDEVWVFDGRNLGRGPLCRLGHTLLNLPFTLHTAWMPSLVPLDAGRYFVEPRDDYGATIAALPPEARPIAEHAYARSRR
ncbi:MAG: carotenoid oxygenase family protein [Deltaproteobacteria bacterium]|nr:carotenoid oxygenase family protein [Deltaproteobacteria bacterium]